MLVDRMGEAYANKRWCDHHEDARLPRDPVAKMFVEVAKAQEEQAFDGTTTCVVLLAELLRLADSRIEEKRNPPQRHNQGLP